MATPKVGDRVRISQDSALVNHRGKEGVVTEIRGSSRTYPVEVKLDDYATVPLFYSEVEVIEPEPAFKVGDVVTGKRWSGEFPVVAVHGEKVWVGLGDGSSYRADYSARDLRLVTPAPIPVTPGIDGEVVDAERRAAQLRSLRSLANKLGYRLVKEEVTA